MSESEIKQATQPALLPEFMREAIRSAEHNVHTGDGGPFGACIVRQEQVIATTHNTVLLEQDATCHAEINAIRLASRKLKTHDLSECIIYSTTEPCPMCFSAIHWAGIRHIVYGTSIQDVEKLGFNEMPISNQRMNSLGHAGIQIHARFLLQECQYLLHQWANSEHRQAY